MRTVTKNNKTANVGNSTGVLPAGTRVWKATRNYDKGGTSRTVLVELITLGDGVIPREARRKVGLRKCRVPAAYVVKQTVLGNWAEGARTITTEEVNESESFHDFRFHYKTGEVVRPDHWNNDHLATCTSGIHVFRTPEEARRYA